MTEFTPGPWEYVPSTEHHGPYVTSNYGSTICDLYVMSNPTDWSVRNGGTSKPNSYLAEMADPNARLIAAAPTLLAALQLLLADADDLEKASEWDLHREEAHAAVAKATGVAS